MVGGHEQGGTVRVALTDQGPIGGGAGYQAGHIAGAVFADLPHELCDTRRPIAFAMPSPDAFCAAVGRLGIGTDTRVVL